MTSPVDIRPDHLEIVQDILIKNLPAGVKVWVFGSRANWTTKDSSDLDLALEGEGKLSHKVLGALKDAFEDSSLPYTVDVVDFNRIGDAFKQIVELQRTPLPPISRSLAMAGEWRETSLGEVIELKRGYDLPKRDRIHGSVPVISSAGVTDYHEASKVSGPGVVTGRYGTLGNVYFIKEDFWPHNTTLYVCDFKGNDPRFISYFLRGIHFLSYSDKAAVPGLNRNHMHTARVLFPHDIKEQRAIAHILGTLDDKIELNRRMNETLEAMARALFKSWFGDFDPVRAKMAGRDTGLPPHISDLFPDRLVPSELGEIPAGWEVKELGELGELAYGKALRAVDRKDGPIPVYGSNGQIGWHDAKLVAGPGIVVGRKGNPGVVTWTQGDFSPIDTTFYVVPKDPGLGLPFLFFALTGQDLPSISADSAVPGLNRNLAYMNKQLVPDKQVLAEFNYYASAIFSRQHQLEEECRSLAALRDALLPGLVSGEVRVKVG